MSLNKLFRNSRIAAAKKSVVAAAVVAGVAGFTAVAKMVDANGKVINSTPSTNSSTSSAGSGGATGFAASNPVVKPPSDVGGGANGGAAYTADKCAKNPSVENCTDNTITQKDWDEFLPPEGFVVRDGRGNVIFKKCRSLTEGAAAAKAEMDPEKARFDRFTTALNINTGGNYQGREDWDRGSYCHVKPSSPEPPMAPCPTMKNYTELRDYYRQQYYYMSNELQNRASRSDECREIRETVMAAADSNWKNDGGVAGAKKSADAASGNRGVR